MSQFNLDLKSLSILCKAADSLSQADKADCLAKQENEGKIYGFKAMYEYVEGKKINFKEFNGIIMPYINKFGFDFVKAFYLQTGNLPDISNNNKNKKV